VSDFERDRNPWTPPTAELGDPGESRSRRLGWKAYFFVMALLFPASYLLTGVGWMQPVDVVDLAVTTTALVGLFGFAYRRRIAERRFWVVWLPLEIVWDLALVFLFMPAGLAYQIPDETQSSSTRWEELSGLVFLIPLYVALYLYANRSPELWERA
jgi:hypothetical protein